MKKRTGGRSPDRSDALMIGLDVLRQKHGLRTQVTVLKNAVKASASAWLDFVKAKSRSVKRLTHS